MNAAAERLATLLPAVNPDVYPTTKRELERIYNAWSPFSYGYWIYGVAFVSLLLAFGPFDFVVAGKIWGIHPGLYGLAVNVSIAVIGSLRSRRAVASTA